MDINLNINKNLMLNFLIFEVISYIIFSILNTIYFPEDRNKPAVPNETYFSMPHLGKELFTLSGDNIRGLIERIMLTAGLSFGYPQVLTFFGALKLGTRFDQQNHCKATTHYFVLGNTISIIISILIVKWAPFHL